MPYNLCIKMVKASLERWAKGIFDECDRHETTE